jgi:succinate dehydrogenase / fumarate reductase iron-sulfur subunit
VNWLKHTLWFSEGNRLDYKPVNLQPLTVDTFKPKHVLSKGRNMTRTLKFKIYRYDPDKDAKPYMQDLTVELKTPTRCCWMPCKHQVRRRRFAGLRRSCREGVCGSDAMNINGKNGLACTTNLNELTEPIVLRPLPGLPVIRDLIVDMTQFFKQYDSIKPYLINDSIRPKRSACSRPKSVKSSTACTSASCAPAARPPARRSGGTGQVRRPGRPAASLPLHRRQRDEATGARLDNLEDPYRLFRCHTIMNCVDVCPKGLNPTRPSARSRN